jgi:hypothetical protein
VSHSPTASQRPNVHGRARRAQLSGSVQRPCGWNAGPRGESISPGPQHAAVLVVAREQQPPLHPVARPALVDDRLAGDAARPRADRSERRTLVRVVHDDGAEKRESGEEGGHGLPMMADAPGRRAEDRDLTVDLSRRPRKGRAKKSTATRGGPMSETTTADSAADQAREKAQEAGTQAKEKAQEVRGQARDRVRSEFDRRSTEAGDQAGSAAQALRRASEELRQDGNEPAARGMEQAAQRVESAGNWLCEADGDRILRDVEDFGRRNPLAVAAGGLALGFAASRLLKASSRDRYEQSRSEPAYAGSGQSRGAAVVPDSTVGHDPGAPPRNPVPTREGTTLP